MPYRPRLVHYALRLRARPSRARGFTLIEVLVAIVVLSFGMLGMVGMQAFALQSNRDSRLQSQAVGLARELAEMMRGNKVVSVLTTGNPYIGDFANGATFTANYCLNVSNANTGCTTPANVASAQMTDWVTRVESELPGARVRVCFDDAPYDSDGLPQWACSATPTNGIAIIKIGWTRASTDRSLTGTAALEQAADTNSRPNLILPVTGGNAL